MKTNQVLASAIVAIAICEVTQAQTFTYNPGDLLAAFRKAGSPDLIIDLGSASTFQTASSSFAISGVNATLLNSVFGNTDGLFWSVFGAVSTTGSPLGAKNTLFVTDARGDVNTQNDPNPSSNSSGQGQVVSKMNGIADGAKSGFATILANQIVEVPSSLNVGGDPLSYTIGVGSFGDFNGTWAPSVENSTGTSFAAGTTPSVSDLFEQDPGLANNGVYLGNFALGNDGTLTFNVSPVPEPSTYALLGAGLMTFLAIRHPRRSKTTKP